MKNLKNIFSLNYADLSTLTHVMGHKVNKVKSFMEKNSN